MSPDQPTASNAAGELDICPQCGGDDLSTGPVSDGSEQTVCLTCGWDTEHGTTTELCRGRCGRWVDDKLLCCDPCWARIPSRVPGFDRPWRSARRHARAVRSWKTFDDATDAARAWLDTHPARIGGTVAGALLTDYARLTRAGSDVT